MAVTLEALFTRLGVEKLQPGALKEWHQRTGDDEATSAELFLSDDAGVLSGAVFETGSGGRVTTVEFTAVLRGDAFQVGHGAPEDEEALDLFRQAVSGLPAAPMETQGA
jgi:hypothetical protein